MKRFLTAMLAAMLLLGLYGCGRGDSFPEPKDGGWFIGQVVQAGGENFSVQCTQQGSMNIKEGEYAMVMGGAGDNNAMPELQAGDTVRVECSEYYDQNPVLITRPTAVNLLDEQGNIIPAEIVASPVSGEICEVNSGGMGLVISNNTEFQIEIGAIFKLEVLAEDGIWRELEYKKNRDNFDIGADMMEIEAGQSRKLKIDWTGQYGTLKAGTYRIEQSISGGPACMVEFTIE